MTGEVNPKKRSLAWNFFVKQNKKHARCNFCGGIFTYDTTSSHLIKHVRKKHSKEYLRVTQERDQKQEESTSPEPSAGEMSASSRPEKEARRQTDASQNKEELCDNSVADSVVHTEQNHSEEMVKCNSPQKEPSTNGFCNEPAEENASSSEHNSKDPEENASSTGHNSKDPEQKDETSTSEVNMKLKRSAAWQYFTLIDKTHSCCKFCQMTVCHRSISNLMQHMIRKHPLELLDRTQKEKEEDTDDENDDSAWEPSAISDVEEDSGAEEVDTTPEKHDVCSADETSRLRRSKRLKTDDSPRKEERDMQSRMTNVETVVVSTTECLPLPLEHSALPGENASGEMRAHSSFNKGRWGKKPGSGSSIWENFVRLPDGRFECALCGCAMAKSSSISNLWRHIRRAHEPGARKSLRAAKVRISSPFLHTLKTEVPEPEEHPSGQAALDDRLLRAVEEGNELLRGLRTAVERQGEALDRLVACLQGMTRGEPRTEGPGG